MTTIFSLTQIIVMWGKIEIYLVGEIKQHGHGQEKY
jgi:hypothetical protein